MLLGAGMVSIFPQQLLADSVCDVEHPFMPPRPEYKEVCHNCGMKRSMWARTWHSYSGTEGDLEVCSIHCLAEAANNSGTVPGNVRVALYLDPETTIPVEQAWYVVGSRARGTMAMKSKLAFPSEEEGAAFAGECGGSLTDFAGAYAAAAGSIAKENEMINSNRVAKGKIVEPVDNRDVCPVCGMYPARYPSNKCQLLTADGEVIHFCATQCLFEFLKNPQKYQKTAVQVNVIWVIDYQSGSWIYGRNAYYVVGTPVKGPMGKEAFPFVNLEEAKTFSTAHSGKVLRFDKVSIDQIML